ncbi:3-oxoacyl-ACP synthase III family protein [Streptomyces sp. ACT015]|uniref:3-oxoacyl-ACP synthase III family protein n=1 Tax=Streptomyces sp. ACT015 TaxID=3134807 RepID=UPI003D177255
MPLGILDVSGYVPRQVVGNSDISSRAGVDKGWIESRTGILERRYAPDRVATSDLAVQAAEPLVRDKSVRQRMGAVIVATATPDQPQPATASFVQAGLQLPPLPAFDVNAVCSGFLYAIAAAEGVLAAQPSAAYALVIGADKFSSIMDPNDPRTVSLFGDGAGAALLGQVPEGYGIRGKALVADGATADFVRVEGGGTRAPLDPEAISAGDQLFRMDGRAVKEWALQFVPKVVDEALLQAGESIDDMDRVIFHQGNANLVQSLATKIGIPPEKVALTAPFWGNTAAASIPLTLSHENELRGIRRGEKILLASVGGGMTAAAVVLTWF